MSVLGNCRARGKVARCPVIFNRGAWCPYCNAQRRAFQRASATLADPPASSSTRRARSWSASTPAAPSVGWSPRTWPGWSATSDAATVEPLGATAAISAAELRRAFELNVVAPAALSAAVLPGVTANVDRPGPVDTAMQAWIRSQDPDRIGPVLHERPPADRSGRPRLTAPAGSA